MSTVAVTRRLETQNGETERFSAVTRCRLIAFGSAARAGRRQRRRSRHADTAPPPPVPFRSALALTAYVIVCLLRTGCFRDEIKLPPRDYEGPPLAALMRTSMLRHACRACGRRVIFLRNRLKYALTNSEVPKIVMQRLIKVDGKVRTDPNYPAGLTDVVTIEKTPEIFRVIYDVKGRFTIHSITPKEAKYKLCKVKRVQTGPKGIPFLVTQDGRTIRYPDPVIKVNDTVQLDIASEKIMVFIKFDSGNLCMITGGRNLVRVGTVVNRERHPESFDIVHIKDANGHTFATRLNKVFIIGKATKPYVSLPRGKGVKLSIAEERDKRLAAKAASG
ncbi:40S ribosomal protein S4-like [Schistocerca piceifrons]|uniref:40S ribosomal protein S4-like n=1 Tax=Schistocerca piceifrons TaxID=274613 RepID=UPI001F5E4B90|nr:40S ribosomal protein S4-like [Schistocerca piceifrons]